MEAGGRATAPVSDPRGLGSHVGLLTEDLPVVSVVDDAVEAAQLHHSSMGTSTWPSMQLPALLPSDSFRFTGRHVFDDTLGLLDVPPAFLATQAGWAPDAPHPTPQPVAVAIIAPAHAASAVHPSHGGCSHNLGREALTTGSNSILGLDGGATQQDINGSNAAALRGRLLSLLSCQHGSHMALFMQPAAAAAAAAGDAANEQASTRKRKASEAMHDDAGQDANSSRCAITGKRLPKLAQDVEDIRLQAEQVALTHVNMAVLFGELRRAQAEVQMCMDKMQASWQAALAGHVCA